MTESRARAPRGEVVGMSEAASRCHCRSAGSTDALAVLSPSMCLGSNALISPGCTGLDLVVVNGAGVRTGGETGRLIHRWPWRRAGYRHQRQKIGQGAGSEVTSGL